MPPKELLEAYSNRELIAEHCKKGPLGMSLPSLIIIILPKNIIPMHTIFIKNHNLLILIFLIKKKNSVSKEYVFFRSDSVSYGVL